MDIKNKKRRDFLSKLSYGSFFGGIILGLFPFIKSLKVNNSSNIKKATEFIDIDLSNIKIGESKVIQYNSTPIFIKRRTLEEIEKSKQYLITNLKDPELDSDRVFKNKEEWVILVGFCTHLKCIPIESTNGWDCPCHSSKFDSCGRVLSGPAPKNLVIPKYTFISENIVRILSTNE